MSARCGVPWLATGAATRARCSPVTTPAGRSSAARRRWCGRHILSRLIDTPSCVLYEFSELSELLQLIGDRLLFSLRLGAGVVPHARPVAAAR